MARYYDLDSLRVSDINVGTVMFPRMERCILLKDIESAPTADVVPKSEVENLRHILDEIDNYLDIFIEREVSFAEEEHSKGHYPEAEAHDYAKDIIEDIRQIYLAELKKKYTEENK